MNALTPFWSVNEPCDQSLHWLQRRLARAGLRQLQTFDLHDARLGTAACDCPHHGTRSCDCQMVVLLVYEEGHPPVTLVVHGNDQESWVSVIDRPDQRADPQTILAIRRALEADTLPEA
ncbi:MAG TPA: hypothetical protein VLL49_10060 [Anaerolineales bacterium]|nr:hypothetical protein [Anaerolineales bacterium]